MINVIFVVRKIVILLRIESSTNCEAAASYSGQLYLIEWIQLKFTDLLLLSDIKRLLTFKTNYSFDVDGSRLVYVWNSFLTAFLDNPPSLHFNLWLDHCVKYKATQIRRTRPEVWKINSSLWYSGVQFRKT